MGKTLVLHFLEKSKEKTAQQQPGIRSYVNETVDKQLGSPELFVSK